MKTTIALCGAAVMLFAAISSRADIIAGPITNPANGHDYYLLSPNAWTLSEAEAEVLGGTLAIIKNASEQDWVFSTFSKRVNHNGLWIGLHRIRMDGPFVWKTEAPTNYFDWGTGEPNNVGGVENCVHIQNGSSDTGTWNDISDDHLFNGVVELPGRADQVSLSKSERALIGSWYEGGNVERPCWIAGTDNALFVISNNNKFATRAGLCADGCLLVPGWPMDSGRFGPNYSPSFPRPQTGLRGEIIKDKILWSNGTWWSRKPSN
jgi:hypothetical protein